MEDNSAMLQHRSAVVQRPRAMLARIDVASKVRKGGGEGGRERREGKIGRWQYSK